MAKKFSELRAAMSPEARAQAAELAQTMLNEMPLHELRQVPGLSQKMLAEVLHVQQLPLEEGVWLLATVSWSRMQLFENFE